MIDSNFESSQSPQGKAKDGRPCCYHTSSSLQACAIRYLPSLGHVSSSRWPSPPLQASDPPSPPLLWSKVAWRPPPTPSPFPRHPSAGRAEWWGPPFGRHPRPARCWLAPAGRRHLRRSAQHACHEPPESRATPSWANPRPPSCGQPLDLAAPAAFHSGRPHPQRHGSM